MTALGTFFKFLSLIGSFTAIGTLLAMAFLLLDFEGRFSTQTHKLKRLLWSSAIVWSFGSAGTIIVTLATILDQSISIALDPHVLRSFITQITLGQYLFFELIIALVVAISAYRIKSILTAAFVLFLSIIGLVAPVFQSHSESSGSHGLAIGALVIHVAALSLWVGGVIAIALLDPKDRPIAVSRFSELALWSVVAVVASGTVNAWVRLDFQGAWNSAYAYVVITKIVVTLILISIGYMHRTNLALRERIDWLGFGRLIFVEAIILVAIVAMGAWLSTNEPLVRPIVPEFDSAVAVTGISTPPPPTWSRILFSYEPDALMIGVLITAVALYIKGVLVMRRRGDNWPVGRSIAFGLGIAGIDFATSGGLGLYAHFAFSYHMVAHMVLGMIAPIGIVLGAPITLALRTLPQGRNSTERGVRGTLLAALHSRVAMFFTNPIVALAFFDGSLFALYFTGLFGGMMQSYVGHLFMSIHFILAGILFFHVIIGIDPNPRRIPHLVRIVIVFAAMSIHAFFSVALMSSTTLIDQGYFASLKTPWLTDLLADQQLGGSIGWAMGEIPILLALVATFISWVKDDSREAKRIDRNTSRAAAMGQPDELAVYNEYLQKLAERDRNDA
ncbi:MAG: cytochrome c oxidase assembly protein [Candidatus Planktophila sp.]|nr:cytochrome c oxidase assembly protein [Candidatus Planktophila sp.]